MTMEILCPYYRAMKMENPGDLRVSLLVSHGSWLLSPVVLVAIWVLFNEPSKLFNST